MKKTSLTHPLHIAEVAVGRGFGLIGVTFCPGKCDPTAMSGHWDRDMEADIAVIRNWAASSVISLVEMKELVLLKAETLGVEVRRHGIEWFHLPIVDVSIPDKHFERQWDLDGKKIRDQLRAGRNVLVHCRGGLGRAGMIAARLLVELGLDAKVAIERVRAVRPGAIETRAQERYVMAIKQNEI